MIFLFIFLHFLATGRALIGDACDFTVTGQTNDGCGGADVANTTKYRCVKQGGTEITDAAEWALAGCTANDPFKSCICQNVATFHEAGQQLNHGEESTLHCQSGVAYREITDDKTKLMMGDWVKGKDPKAAPQGSGSNTKFANTNITGTVGRCGIPEGDFCLVTESGTGGINKTDFCMPGFHCYTGFGDAAAKNGICMDDDTIFTKNAWLVKFKQDTLDKLNENEQLAKDNKTEIKKNNTAIGANLTAIDLAKKENNDWFRGATDPGDDVPDFKERGKLLLTTTVFIGVFVLPSVLYLVWKQCSQPPQKRSRRANVKASDSDSDES